MSWLFLHWYSILSTSWLCLYFFLLPVLFKSCLAVVALFVTSIVNCMSSYCGCVELLTLSFPTSSSLFLTVLLSMGVSTWNPSSLLSVSLALLANLWLAACFLASYFFFSKWNPSGFSKNVAHGRRMFLCWTRLFSPSWLFSGRTSYSKLPSPLQSTII